MRVRAIKDSYPGLTKGKIYNADKTTINDSFLFIIGDNNIKKSAYNPKFRKSKYVIIMPDKLNENIKII